MTILEKTKTALLNIKHHNKSFGPLFDYFESSEDFVLRGKRNGIEIPKHRNSICVDGETNDKNKFREYIASDKSFIIYISAYDLRLILIDIEQMGTFNGYGLQKIERRDKSIPKYKIVGAKQL